MTTDVTRELAAALRNLLYQTYQMREMFPDDDSTITNSIEDAEAALQLFRESTAA